MTRLPNQDDQEQRPLDREQPQDSLAHWSKVERWSALGKQVCDLRDRARRAGVPIESLPGARAAIEAFRALGRELQRSGR